MGERGSNKVPRLPTASRAHLGLKDVKAETVHIVILNGSGVGLIKSADLG